MWIQLLQSKRISLSGKDVQYNSGDWVDVGKHVALLWLSDGSAQIPEIAESGFDLSNAGILTDRRELLCNRLKLETKSITIVEGRPCLPFEKTIILDSMLPFRASLIPVGVSLLDTWEMAVPLMDYKTLALHLEDENERARTKEVIHDLRVPVYDIRLMFIRKKPDTERLIDNWRDNGGGALAFLREVYRIKPLILALPCTWTVAGMPKPE